MIDYSSVVSVNLYLLKRRFKKWRCTYKANTNKNTKHTMVYRRKLSFMCVARANMNYQLVNWSTLLFLDCLETRGCLSQYWYLLTHLSCLNPLIIQFPSRQLLPLIPMLQHSPPSFLRFRSVHFCLLVRHISNFPSSILCTYSNIVEFLLYLYHSQIYVHARAHTYRKSILTSYIFSQPWLTNYFIVSGNQFLNVLQNFSIKSHKNTKLFYNRNWKCNYLLWLSFISRP